jgi:DnaJ-class molecular chaperone
MKKEEKNRNKHLAGIISESVEINVEGKVECEVCNGQGEGMFSCCTGDMVDSDWARCPKCLENLGEEECYSCEGTGLVDA